MFKHFSELNQDNINFDFHIHTDFTDGDESPETMVDAAIKKGLKEIAFTEHITRETTWYKSFAETVFQLKRMNRSIEISRLQSTRDNKTSLPVFAQLFLKKHIEKADFQAIPSNQAL